MQSRTAGRSVAAVVALAAVTGCTAQAAGPGGSVPPVRISTSGPPGHSAAPRPERPSAGPATQAPPVKKPAARKPAPVKSRPAAPPAVMKQGSESRQVRELQARLVQSGHFHRSPTGYYGSVTATAVSAFQGAHGLPRTGVVDSRTWHKVQALTDVPGRDQLYPPTTLPPSEPDPRCLTGRALCISKKSRTLVWMVNGSPRSAMDVRFGSEYTPTREGQFKVYWKSRDHVSTIYDTPMPYALFFSGGQAVHFSADFAANGYGGASHGCVNVRDKAKIAALFGEVKNGDKVVIYK